MKVYNRNEFLQLPEGTIFCKGGIWVFENMCIKRQTYGNDFSYVDLCNIDSYDTEDWINRLENSLNKGISYPINKNTSRDGSFNELDLFMVFEEEDLEFLVKIMKDSINVLRHRPVP